MSALKALAVVGGAAAFAAGVLLLDTFAPEIGVPFTALYGILR